MSQWSDIRNRLASKWQIPLLFVSLLLLVGAFVGGRPSPDDLPIEDAVRYMESRVRGGAFDGAVKIGETLLAREHLTAPQRAPVLLQMARSRFGQARLDGVESGERGHQIQQYYEMAVRHGAALAIEDQRAMGDVHSWQGQFGHAIEHYRLAVAGGIQDACDLRKHIYLLSVRLGAAADALDVQLQDILASVEPHRLDLRVWALEQKLHVLQEMSRLDDAATLLVRNAELFKESDFAIEFDYLNALLLARQQRFDEAERLLRVVRNRADVNGSVHAKAGWLLGTVVMNDGNPQRPYEASAFFRDVISGHAGGSYAIASRVGLAESLVLVERHDEALGEYRLAIDEIRSGDPVELGFLIDTGRVRALLGIAAQSQKSVGKFREAVAYAKLALELVDPSNEEQEAAFLQQLAEIQEAAAHELRSELEVLASSDPDAAGLMTQRALEYLADAAQSFVRISKIHSINEDRSAESTWRAAELFRQAGMLSRAAKLYESFVQERPEHSLVARALLRMGQVHQRLGDLDRAISAFQECYRRFPRTIDGARGLIPLARCYLTGGDERIDLGEKTLRIVLEDSELFTPAAPEFADALFLLGEVQIRGEAYEKAIASLEETLDRYPHDPREWLARSKLADAYRLSGLALKKEAKSTRAPDNLTYLAEESTRRLDDALALYRAVIDEYALRGSEALNEIERVDWRLAHVYEADCYFETGSFAEALQRYQESAGLYKDTTTSLAAYVQIINCHVFLGQREEAASALARAMVLVETVPEEAFTRSVSPEGRQDWKRYFDWLAATELF